MEGAEKEALPMVRLNRYTQLSLLNEGPTAAVYRGSDEEGRAVVIKLMREEYPKPADLHRIRSEFEIRKRVAGSDGENIVELEPYRNGLLLISRDCIGEPIASVTGGRPLAIADFLDFAIAIVEALARIHAVEIVHGSVMPRNIVWDATTKKATLVDFAKASPFGAQVQGYDVEDIVDLSYMAPEQTGRIARPVDSRTDIYSLGITFFELLTGELPFRGTDPLELVHAHIAKQPARCHEINPNVPVVISAIVWKAMAKAPERRYQTAQGMLADLRYARENLDENGEIPMVDLGLRDRPLYLHLSQKLYGREEAVRDLEHLFMQVGRDEPRITIIDGDPGIGKSSVVHELRSLIIERQAMSVTGKFDPFLQGVPFNGLVAAINQAVTQILASGETVMLEWRERFLKVLDGNGSLLVDLAPQLELIIGQQSAVADLGPIEAKNRLVSTIGNFVLSLARTGRPLVLFIDDLQWIDEASLAVLQYILGRTKGDGWFFIGSYRTDEVGPLHPLRFMLDGLKRDGIAAHTLRLRSLSKDDVANLLTDSFNVWQGDLGEFATAVWEKTGGNPFFVMRFLKSLFDRGLLKIDMDHGWIWDIKSIVRMEITSNVAQFLADTIASMPEACRVALQAGACFGGRFDIAALSIALEKPVDTLFADLREAIAGGYLISLGEGQFKFAHDKVHEAAYKTMDHGERTALHFRIGMALLNDLDRKDDPGAVFSLLHHLNLAKDLLGGDDDRHRVAHLNFQAAQRSRVSANYGGALLYAEQALALFGASLWKRDHATAFALHFLRAECFFLLGRFPDSVEAYRQLQDRCINGFEKARVGLATMGIAHTTGDFVKTADIGIASLRLLGVHVAHNPSKFRLFFERTYLRLIIHWIGIKNFVKVPETQDPKERLISNLFISLGRAAYVFNKNLYGLGLLMQARRVLSKGVVSISSTNLMPYAAVRALAGNVAEAEQIAQQAMAIMRRFKEEDGVGLTLFAYGGFIMHRTHPLRKVIIELERSFLGLQRKGDIVGSGLPALYFVSYALLSGRPLREVLEECQRFIDAIREMKNKMLLDCTLPAWMMANALSRQHTETPNLSLLDLSEADYVAGLAQHKTQNPFGWYSIHRLWFDVLFRRYADALHHVKGSEVFALTTPFAHEVVLRHFYLGLLYAATIGDVAEAQREDRVSEIRGHLAKVGLWAKSGPENTAAIHLILQGEYERITGRERDALESFDRAIDLAREHGLPQYQALANELAARLCQRQQRETLSLMYAKEAIFAYQTWGAQAKVDDVVRQFPELALGEFRVEGRRAGNADGGGMQSLDIGSILKSSNVLVSEMNLDKLVGAVTYIMAENAGAERGLLLLCENDNWSIRSEVLVENVGDATSVAVPLESCQEISHSIVAYVQNTKHPIVFNEGDPSEGFASDPYIFNFQPKSILCYPIVSTGTLRGLVYLEHRSAPGVFTTERLEILKILAGQAAISLENARMYSEMREKMRMEGELETAQLVQRTLFPEETADFGAVQVAGSYEAASECGGDWWFYNEIGESVFVWIGDVSGHGAGPALVTSAARAAVAVVRDFQDMSPARALAHLNRAVNQVSRGRLGMTFFTGSLDKNTGLFTYANASHPNPILVRAGDIQAVAGESNKARALHRRLLHLQSINGPMLGDENTSVFSYPEERIQLEPGDMLLFFTDGLTEAYNRANAMWEERRMLRAFCEAALAGGSLEEVVGRLRESCAQFRRDEPMRDDITFCVLRYVGKGT